LGVAREYPNPTAQTIAAARVEYQSYIDWLSDDVEGDDVTPCEKSGQYIDDDPNDPHLHVCPYDCES
jgi:hypothetical protein